MTSAFIFVALLLLLGVIARQIFSPLRRLFIPASMVAGFAGLAIVATGTWQQAPEASSWLSETSQVLSGWPGPLIAIVFAAMLLQPTDSARPGSLATDKDQSVARRVGLQGLMVWIIVLGETATGLIATGLLILPYREGIPNSFGMLIETGFAGGHGTAAAMGQVFNSDLVGFDAGLDLGLLMATCGLVYGLLSGIFWINLAVRKGWIRPYEQAGDPKHDPHDQQGRDPERKAIGYERLSPDTIDPLLLQVVWIACAIGIALLAQSWVQGIASLIDSWMGMGAGSKDAGAEAELAKRLTFSSVADFPLFIYAMGGGWLVKKILTRFHANDLIDPLTIGRLSALAMEVLVVAAITSLKVSTVLQLIVPFSILLLVGAIWTAVCLLVISPIVLPKQHWFQLGIINYGMSTGTTATGFVLLRLIDPDFESDAANDYALAAPLSSPFIGGGIVTIGLPLLVLERVPIIWPALVISVIVCLLIMLGRRFNQSSSTE